MSVEQAKPENETARGAGQMLVDLGPVVVFVLSYNILRGRIGDEAIYWATGLFIGATLAAIAYSWFRTRHIPPVLLVTGVLVVAFGGLTLVLRDENFIKLKPTFVYLFYAAAIFGAALFRLNLWKLLFKHAFTLPDRIWNILSLRWGAFFVFMAIVNEAIRLNFSTDFWVQSRLFIVYPLIIGFTLLNLPMMMKHIGKDAEAAPPAESN